MKLLNAAIKTWSLIQTVPGHSLTQYNFSAWNNKAVALNGLKRYGEAFECSNKALEINPKNEWAWASKALVFNGLKRYEEPREMVKVKRI